MITTTTTLLERVMESLPQRPQEFFSPGGTETANVPISFRTPGLAIWHCLVLISQALSQTSSAPLIAHSQIRVPRRPQMHLLPAHIGLVTVQSLPWLIRQQENHHSPRRDLQRKSNLTLPQHLSLSPKRNPDLLSCCRARHVVPSYSLVLSAQLPSPALVVPPVAPMHHSRMTMLRPNHHSRMPMLRPIRRRIASVAMRPKPTRLDSGRDQPTLPLMSLGPCLETLPRRSPDSLLS